MLAKNVAHQAVLQVAHVLCVTAADLLLDLGGQETTRTTDRAGGVATSLPIDTETFAAENTRTPPRNGREGRYPCMAV